MTQFDNTTAVPAATEPREVDLFAAFAEAGTDEGVANRVVDIVASTPGLIAATRSGIDPESIQDPKVVLVTVVLDSSGSVRGLLSILGASHDEFVNALKPACKEGVTYLVTAILLDGTVVYPYTRVQDAPLFGREPGVADRMILNGLSYDHMSTLFRFKALATAETKYYLIESTPLTDRINEAAAAMLVEGEQYENPRINREIEYIMVTLTDGLATPCSTSLADLGQFMAELDDMGNFNQGFSFLGDLNPDGVASLRDGLGRRLDEGYLTTDQFASLRRTIGKRDDALVSDSTSPYRLLELATPEELVKWFFGLFGCPANRVYVPGQDPKAIRRSVGQLSQLAMGSLTEDMQ